MKRIQSGFTLIEVLIAVAIAAGLAGTLTMMIAGQSTKVREVFQKAVINDLQAALSTLNQDLAICKANLDTSIDATLVFNSTLANPKINLSVIRSGLGVGRSRRLAW